MDGEYEENKEDILKKRKKYYEENKEDILKKRKKYYEENKEDILKNRKDYNKRYREENLDFLKKYNIDYYDKNRNIILEKQKKYNEVNKEEIKKYQREYKSIRSKFDNLFKLSKNIRTLVKNSLNFKKSKKTTEIIGCEITYLKTYLESRFEYWMSWENYGLYNGELNYGWDIDHITPLSSAKTEEELIKLSHYTNLQPLCSKVNRYIKKDKEENTNCLYCNKELSYIKYCNDNCRKKYYRNKKK